MGFLKISQGCILFIMLLALTSASFIVSKENMERIILSKRDLSDFNAPEIYEMNIRTNVTNRYAKTSISSRVRNSGSKANEAVFFVILPEKAFISEFSMEIGGKTYKAYVKEKKEAKTLYDQAVDSGQSAAHIGVSARDSNRFTVSLNIEPNSKAIFKLTYEELLQRQKDKYEIVLNIHPGQIVEKLDVVISINETAPLSFVRTPSLRSGNEISKNNDGLNTNAEIITVNPSSSIVKFYPDIQQQKMFARSLDGKENEGLKGQFIVEYDVERTDKGGEVLMNDEYFVHFFAPKEMEVMAKHVVFVLDISGSMMGGGKLQQLIKAMKKILQDLNEHDVFTIIGFETSVLVWDINSNKFIDLNISYNQSYGNLDKILMQKQLPSPVKVTPGNIEKAKKFVSELVDLGITNIMGGLEVGLFMAKSAQIKESTFHQPLLIFLTDGLANSGISNNNRIIEIVSKINPKEKQIPIFTLSFGDGAAKGFLKKLSSRNLGSYKHIYEASDASLQLENFYQSVASPLLKNVVFKYSSNVTSLTKHEYPLYFNGSEFAVSGKIPSGTKKEYSVEGWKSGGVIEMKPKVLEKSESLERLWAYLSLRQILDEIEVSDKKDELTRKAVDLALKYSFVTPVTSLVVVKPNDTTSVNTEDASKPVLMSSSRGRTYTTQNFITSTQRPITTPKVQNYYPYRNIQIQSSDEDSRSYIVSGFKNSFSSSNIERLDTNYMLSSPTNSNNLMSSPFDFLPFSKPVPLPELEKQGWFKILKVDQYTIRHIFRSYKLAKYTTIVSTKSCSKTLTNKSGLCKPIHECPKAIPSLTDFLTFASIFCEVEGYAGLCCDM